MLYNHATNNAEATARTMLTLEKFYGVKYLGIVGGDMVVELLFCNPFRDDGQSWNSYEWFTLHDNGEEINVEPINHAERMRSIPSTSHFFTLTAETMAYRIFFAMTGQEIDWNDNDMPAIDIDGTTMKIM